MIFKVQPFLNREDAGRQLAAALPALEPATTVVVALPRGGVPVAEEICKAHHLPLDLVFVRKIGVPRQPEVAAGAVVDGAHPIVIVNRMVARSAGLSTADVENMGRGLLPEIERRKARYLRGVQRPSLEGRTIVVVDDGVATGSTVKASLKALRNSGALRTILALPTAPPDVLPSLAQLADETVCLHQPEPFYAVGAAYRSFSQVSDEAVAKALRRCAGFAKEGDDV